MEQNEEENLFSELQLPPLDSEITKLITFDTDETQNLNQEIKETKNIIEKFQQMFDQYLKKCEKTLSTNPDVISFVENIPKGATPSLNFAFLKLSKLIVKHKNLTREIYAQIAATISVTSVFFTVLLSKNIPATFDFEGFNEYTKKVFRKNQEYQKIYKKIKILQEYCIRNHDLIDATISFDELMEGVPTLRDFFCTKFNYTPTSPFDILLETFLISHNFMPTINNICKDISGNGSPMPVNANTRVYQRKKLVRMNPTSFNNLFEEFTMHVKEKLPDIEDHLITSLKNSLLRILFNKIYLHDPLISAYDIDFQKNAFAIMHLTPDDLGMPPVFKGEERKMNFIDLFSKYEELQIISNILTTLQFFTDPLDIAFEVCKVSSILEDFAAKMSPTDEVIKLSFDDFFILFVVCISSADIPNSEGIRLSVDFYSDLEASQSMHHAITSISAAIKFIKDLISGNQIPELVPKCKEILKSFK